MAHSIAPQSCLCNGSDSIPSLEISYASGVAIKRKKKKGKEKEKEKQQQQEQVNYNASTKIFHR